MFNVVKLWFVAIILASLFMPKEGQATPPQEELSEKYIFEDNMNIPQVRDKIKKLEAHCPYLFGGEKVFIKTVKVSDYYFPLYFFDENYTGKGGFDGQDKSWENSIEVAVELKNGGKILSFYVSKVDDSGVVTVKRDARIVCQWKNRDGFNLYHKY